MALNKDLKQQLVKEYALKEGDTGSPEVQIAILTYEINLLNQHLSIHTHDYLSKRGLLQKVGHRRDLLKYLKTKDYNRYEALIKKLNLRR